MNLASNIAPHLPKLRRFSRALNGSQKIGDAYVAAMLEAIVENPEDLDRSIDLRLALYRMFCSMWESLSLRAPGPRQDPSGDGHVRRAQEHLSSMPPTAREAFLLIAVEQFTLGEVSQILQRDEADVERLMEEASQAIMDQVATSVLIIEDEPMIAMDLVVILESLGHSIVRAARTRSDAVAAAARSKPGLVLADIQLADGSSGIDAVNQILQSHSCPVIFITAFPEHLLTGARPEPAFLITKPYTTDMVKAVVSQALFFGMEARAAA